uniref:Uncharacterized protein n=1 Tax=Cryptomonas curvata TaxID=233186 RepID=A0A7S0MXS5_9CRYP
MNLVNKACKSSLQPRRYEEPHNLRRVYDVKQLRAEDSTSASSSDSDNVVSTSARKMSVILRPDFRVALSVLAIFFLRPCPPIKWLAFLIGTVLILQTARLRFRFTSDQFDVLRVKGLDSKVFIGPQVVAIGPWPLRSIVDWELWWPGFPVLAYFKEVHTKSSGQRHFFPVLSDGKDLYSQMLLNFGPSTSEKPAIDEWESRRPLDPNGYRLLKTKIFRFLMEDVSKYLVIAARKISAALFNLVQTLKQLLSS